MYQLTIVVGNLGKEPEMRYTPSGQAVCSFNVASSRTYTSNGQQVKETTWFKVSAWGKLAETCSQYLHKGNKCLVQGRLIPDLVSGGPKVFTRGDGTSGASFELNADTVKFLTPKGETGEIAADGELSTSDGDNIPF